MRAFTKKIIPISISLLVCLPANIVYANNVQEDNSVSYSIDKDLYGEKHIVVSLGDSFSSGEGNEPFYGQFEDFDDRVNGTDYDWLAHRSTYCWPGKLKFPDSEEELKEWKDNDSTDDEQWYFAASSGAVTADLLGGQNKEFYRVVSYKNSNKTKDIYNKYLSAMIYNVDSDYYKVLGTPSSLFDGISTDITVQYEGNIDVPPQLSVFDNILQNETDYITMSMGGNDTGFSTIVEAAYRHGSRKNFNYADPNSLFSTITNTIDHFADENGIRDHLKKAYYDVAKAAGYQANIIIAGYPRLINKSGGIGFSSGEALFIDSSVDYFNDKIKTLVEECATEGLNISFCDVVPGFENHEACTLDRYIHTVMLPSRKEDLDTRKISSSYSMHPNKKGTKVYAEYVQKVLNTVADNLKKYRLDLEKSFMNSDKVKGDERLFYFGDFNSDGHYEGFGISGIASGNDLENVSIYYLDTTTSIEKIADFDRLSGYEVVGPVEGKIDTILDTGKSKYLVVGGMAEQPVYLFGVRNLDENGNVISTRHELSQYTFKNTSSEAYQPSISGKFIKLKNSSVNDGIFQIDGQVAEEASQNKWHRMKYNPAIWEFEESEVFQEINESPEDDDIWKYFEGIWETAGQNPYAIRYEFDEQYRYAYTCDTPGNYHYNVKDPVSYQKTDYGYYVSVYTTRGTGGYRLYSDDPDYLECIGDGDPNSLEGYSGTSSLGRVYENELEESVNTLMDLYGDFEAVIVGNLNDMGDYYSGIARIYNIQPTSTEWPGDMVGTEEVKIAKNAIVHWYVNLGEPDYQWAEDNISLEEYIKIDGWADYSSAFLRMMGNSSWTKGNPPLEYNEKGHIVGFYDAPVS